MPATTIELQVNTEYQNAIRFPVWIALAVFSAICVAAVTTLNDSQDRTAELKWTLAVTILSMCLSFIAVLAYLLYTRALFVGQAPEAALIALLVALWGVGLPTIMHPNRGIAVQDTTVVNANLYFFSWVSFAATVFLFGSLLQDTVGVNIHQTPTNHAQWFGLTATSLVVMGASIRIFKDDDVQCANSDALLHGTAFCRRTRLAIAVGVISFVGSAAMTYLMQTGLASIMIEVGVATVLLILWCFGVGYITFGGPIAPGSKIGNLYFATWISFVIIVFLFAQAFRNMVSGGGGGASTTSTEAAQAQPTTVNGDHAAAGYPDSQLGMVGAPPQIPDEEQL